MPAVVKLTISLIVILAAAAGYALQAHLGQVGPKYAVVLLGIFMVVAMWLFPEVTRDEKRHR
ncbi:hypothetical protein [Ancylobacter mangrovi]|uniref:Uncharacterized protein n=1 Tax=Ancylobacter mangrovi TaxID=2972472 RepID=A0A9X2T3K4_9HYPH|nr:hypothetical protein [Ancylobacter mangrovi]MCS0497227.1 hypothetical protein [Ancylobacter mangrovi]MCS0505052.1 hypothetical protein [Ancylobacter mangrovi]